MRQVDVEAVVNFSKWVLAGMAAFLHNIPQLTWLLVILMVVDTIFGLAVAVKDNDLSVRVLGAGVSNKVLRLLIIGLGGAINHFSGFTGIDLVMVFTAFYILPELLSITRNAGLVGIPLPPQLTSVMRAFQEKEDEKDRPLSPRPDGNQGQYRSTSDRYL